MKILRKKNAKVPQMFKTLEYLLRITKKFTDVNQFKICAILKAHNLIFLPNKIRLNLVNTFVVSRNKHISKKTRCFSRKRSKNKAKPNEFERRILKLSCYACSDNPICRHAFGIFRNVSRMNSDLTFSDV